MMENPKFDRGLLLEEKNMNTQKISVLDHTDKSDGFVIDMESFSHAGFNKQMNPNSNSNSNSRIIRSLSRKWSQRGDMKTNTPGYNNSDSTSLNDRDSLVSTSSSPKGSCCMTDKPSAVVAGSTEPVTNQQVHHQITITTAAATETRFSSRRNSCRRSHPPRLLGPKRIFMLFATLSSLGTIMLIYFTLSISKMNGDENGLDQ